MLLNKIYIGTVVDSDDPLKIGRCRVRIGFLHGEIPDENIPWAYPAYNITFGKGGNCGSVSIPKKGAVVQVRFDNGDLYSPVYIAIQELGSDVKKFLQTEYNGVNLLLYDDSEKVKIFYTPKKGILIENDESKINIEKNGHILISNKDEEASVELKNGTIYIYADSQIETQAVNEIKETSKLIKLNGKSVQLGTDAYQSAVCGESLMFLLTQMATAIDMKAPQSTLCSNAVQLSKSWILSDTVKVSH